MLRKFDTMKGSFNFLMTVFIFFSASAVADDFASKLNSVTDAKIISNSLDRSAVSIKLVGALFDKCSAVGDIDLEFGGHERLTPEINVRLTIAHDYVPCLESYTPFNREVFLGKLQEGPYTLNIFENDMLTLSKDFIVPQDIEYNATILPGLPQMLESHSDFFSNS